MSKKYIYKSAKVIAIVKANVSNAIVPEAKTKLVYLKKALGT